MASEWVELTSTDSVGKVHVNLAMASAIRRFGGYTSISFATGSGTMDVSETPEDILRALEESRKGAEAS